MCRREGLQFLGRVPVESDLVGLLDATSRRPPPPAQRILENGDVEEMEVVEEEPLVIPEGSFDLSERYKRTLSSKLFEPMAAEVVRLLKVRTEEEFAEASAAVTNTA